MQGDRSRILLGSGHALAEREESAAAESPCLGVVGPSGQKAFEGGQALPRAAGLEQHRPEAKVHRIHLAVQGSSPPVVGQRGRPVTPKAV